MTDPCPTAPASLAPTARAEVGAMDLAYAQFRAGFLLRLPPEVATSFDERQMFAIWQAFGPPQGRERRRGWHMRLRLPWRSVDVSIRAAAPGEDAPSVTGLCFLAGGICGAVLALGALALLG